MLQTQQTDPATFAQAIVPVVVALVTATTAIIAPRLAARGDDLRRAERLTELLADLPAAPQRELIEQLRDDYATSWALRQAAPAFPGLRAVSRAAYFAGILVLIIGPLSLLLTPGMQWWYWAYYLGGAALLLIGIALGRRRMMRQRRWMAGELRRRGLRSPLDRSLDDPGPPEGP